MKKIAPGYLIPSAAFTIKKSQIRGYQFLDRVPQVGDLVYGKITRLGQHSTLENRSGRVHTMNDGSRAVFVFGNRYAPDHYEGFVPREPATEVDMLARSGVVGLVSQKNTVLKDPTRVRIMGYVCDAEGAVLNTRNYPMIVPSDKKRASGKRAKMILVIGTAMNSGKSMSAAACCWALSSMAYEVRASKITGTASLKDILHMNDAGASIYNDFTYLGYPSTYMLSEEDLLGVFNVIDRKYANNPKNFWVVEFADGILQRETAMLLASKDVQARIHKLIFCAGDALGCIGGIRVLKDRFGLVPDAVSGVFSSAPLARREFMEHTGGIPVLENLERDLNRFTEILL
jgi:hypothetical protein